MKKNRIIASGLMTVAAMAGVVLLAGDKSVSATSTSTQFAAGSATHIATTIITGALVVAAGILWYMSFHRKHTEIKEQYKTSAANSSPKPAKATKTTKTVKTSAKKPVARTTKTTKTAPTRKTSSAKTTKAGKNSKSAKK